MFIKNYRECLRKLLVYLRPTLTVKLHEEVKFDASFTVIETELNPN